MQIALIVFGPFIGAAVAAVIGKRNEKAGDAAAVFVAAFVLALTIVTARGAVGAPPLMAGEETNAAGAAVRFAVPGIFTGGLTFSLIGFSSFSVLTASRMASISRMRFSFAFLSDSNSRTSPLVAFSSRAKSLME